MGAKQSAHVRGLLERLMGRHDVQQAFLFGGDGEPFWAGRVPITPDELAMFRDAVAMIESAESSMKKPFYLHDPAHRFSIAAMSEESNLYLVVLGIGPEADGRAARVAKIREELLPDVAALGPRRTRLSEATS